jgi:hypothetical protein
MPPDDLQHPTTGGTSVRREKSVTTGPLARSEDVKEEMAAGSQVGRNAAQSHAQVSRAKQMVEGIEIRRD